MGADLNCLKGEIFENPQLSNTNTDELLRGFLKALLLEQTDSTCPTIPTNSTHLKTQARNEVDREASLSS